MADTQIAGAGAIMTSVDIGGGQADVTPPIPLNFDGGETFLIDVGLNLAFPIVGTPVKDANNFVTKMTVTGSPTSGNGFCQALSSASKDNIFTTVDSAVLPASAGDIVMFTPGLRSQSMMESNIAMTVPINVTVRSISPIWKLYGVAHSGAGPNSIILNNLSNIEDIIVDAGRDPVTKLTGTGTSNIRRCALLVSQVDSNGAGVLLNIENSLVYCRRGSGGVRSLTNGDLRLKHCFIFITRLKPEGGGTMKMDNCILNQERGGNVPDAAITGDFNWATDPITLPGSGSLTNKNLDDLKLALSETEVGGFPTGPMFAWLPTPAAVFGFTGSPPTVLGATDAERRDFYGNLRPTTGAQTTGPINLETHDSGVAWSTYSIAELTAPNAPVITSAVPASTQVTVNLTGDAGKVHEVFFFLPGSLIPVSGGTRTGDGAIIIAGLTNGITITIIALTQASPTFGPPSLPVAATPAATASTPVGQIPSLIDRIRTFYLNSADFLSWITSFDAGETAADHVFLGYRPTNIKNLLSKGPVAIIEVGDHRVINSGQQTSYDGTLDIVVHHIWAENEDTKDDHMLAYNKMAALENALLKLSPFESTFGSAIMSISGDLTSSFDESDEQWFASFIISLDWGPGE